MAHISGDEWILWVCSLKVRFWFLVFGSRSFLKCTLSCGLLNTVRTRKLFFLVLTVLLTVLLGRSSCSVARTFDSKKSWLRFETFVLVGCFSLFPFFSWGTLNLRCARIACDFSYLNSWCRTYTLILWSNVFLPNSLSSFTEYTLTASRAGESIGSSCWSQRLGRRT